MSLRQKTQHVTQRTWLYILKANPELFQTSLACLIFKLPIEQPRILPHPTKTAQAMQTRSVSLLLAAEAAAG